MAARLSIKAEQVTGEAVGWHAVQPALGDDQRTGSARAVMPLSITRFTRSMLGSVPVIVQMMPSMRR